MEIVLSPQTEDLVNDLMATGQYTSPSEVVASALEILKQHRTLRAEILEGLEDIENGRVTELDPVQILELRRASRSPSSMTQ